MANSTLKRIADLIDSSEPGELRRAAVQVIGVVGDAGDRTLVKALLAVLEDPDATLHDPALEALGRLQAGEVLPRLIEFVKQGGPRLEQAVRTAGHLGARGAKAMAQVMAQAEPAHRRRIAAALGEAGTGTAVLATAQTLWDEDPRVVEAAARSLAAQVPSLPGGQRKTLADHLLEFLHPRNQKRLSSASEAAMLRVLAALHEARAEDVFWARLDATRPAPTRAASLQALGSMPPPTSEAKLKKLLDCALADDFQVVAPALLILKNIPGKRSQVKSWLRLLSAPDVATRRFAVEKLKDIDSPEVAGGFLPQLRHPDKALRDETLAVLRGSRHGRQALVESLLKAETTEEGWPLARALTPTAAELPPAQRARLWAQACKYHDQDDRRDEPLWFLLREMDASWTRDQIEERAGELRKKKKFAEALRYWRLLTRDPACSEEIRFEQAATGLKVSDHDTAALARQANPFLGQFARLLQDAGFDLIGHVSRAKWLDTEDLYYLGFHFAGEKGPARKLGQHVLELVIKKSPRSELGKNARRKLKSEGLA